MARAVAAGQMLEFDDVELADTLASRIALGQAAGRP
jgi:hypothetical protein